MDIKLCRKENQMERNMQLKARKIVEKSINLVVYDLLYI